MSEKNYSDRFSAEQLERELHRVKKKRFAKKPKNVSGDRVSEYLKEYISEDRSSAVYSAEPIKPAGQKAAIGDSAGETQNTVTGDISRETTKKAETEQLPEKTKFHFIKKDKPVKQEQQLQKLSPREQEKLDKIEREKAFEVLVGLSKKHSEPAEEDVSSKLIEAEISRVKHKREYGRVLRETIIILLGVAAVAVLISMLFLPVLRVTGSSMEPTLHSDEIVVCAKYSDFKRGDIVAFYFNNKVLLKRVIGTPGDIIEIEDGGSVIVNGEKLTEAYAENVSLGECDLEFPVQVPENRLFVMGDNRETSIDSRSSEIGYIADEYIIGRVFFRAWPLSKLGTF